MTDLELVTGAGPVAPVAVILAFLSASVVQAIVWKIVRYRMEVLGG